MHRIATVTTICLLLLLFTAGVASAGHPKILVINSYHAEYPWVRSHNQAIRDGLGMWADLTFFNMDTKRLPATRYAEQTGKALDLYDKINPKIVILADDNALALLGEPITERGTPVIYLGINANPRSYSGTVSLMTGVLERPLLKRSIVFIQDILQGNLNKCLVLFDNGSTARATMDTVFKGKSRVVFGGSATDINLVATFAQWKALVLTAKKNGYQAIILGLYHTLVDSMGMHVPAEVVAQWTSANTPVPVFAFWDFAVGKGKAIGGLILAGEPQGREAAKLARRLLAGENPAQIQPVTAEHGRFLFSKYELTRWGISLPPKLAQPSETLELIE